MGLYIFAADSNASSEITGSGTANTLAMFTGAQTIGDSIITQTNGGIAIAQAVATSGSPALALFTGGAHTTLTASVESTDINFNLARTVQFATGALTTQRAALIQAPTYAFVGASTITTAATFAISGAPAAGTNATITNSYALWVQAGNSLLAGSLGVGNIAPTARVHIKGSGATSATTGIKYENSAEALWHFRDDGMILWRGTRNAFQADLSGVSGGSWYLMQEAATTPNFNAYTIGIGNQALLALTGASTGDHTMAIGILALRRFTTGTSNCVVGESAGDFQSGNENALFGASAATNTSATITNERNAGFGFACLHRIYGTNNTGIGWRAGTAWNATGDTTVDIAIDSSIYIGTALVTQSREMVFGGPNVLDTYVNNVYFNGRFQRGGTALQPVTIQNAGVLDTLFSTTTDANSRFGARVLDGSAAAGIMYLAGARGTGTGIGGDIIMQVALAGASGYSQNALTSVVYLKGDTGAVNITQPVNASGSPNLLLLTGGAHTTLAASTEAIDVNVNLARTVQFATGALTTQRATLIQAPTYGFVGASTLTNAATFAVSGSPASGTNATITNSYAIWVQGGQSLMQGQLTLTPAASTGTPVRAYTINSAAHTALTASTEYSDVLISGATQEFGTGAIVTQRYVRIDPPTYAFVGASTITTAATFSVNGGPVVGTNASITNSFAGLFTASGTQCLGAERTDDNDNSSSCFIVRRSRSSGTAPGANFGGIITWQLEGFTNNTYVGAASIATNWEIAQTNDTTARDSYMLFSTMLNNVGTPAIRINSSGMTFFGASTNATAWVHISAGTAAIAPIRLTSGTLTTGGNILAGNVEFLTDKFYATITTGPAQKEITLNDAALTSGRVPFVTTNGRLTDDAGLAFASATTGLAITTRFSENQGADVASGTNLTLGNDGNVFEITGTTQIDLILITNWKNGSLVTLVFNESVTVRHGIATSGSNVTILLAGAANFAATANDTLTLVLSETTAGGQAWRELARTAI